ncbi:hypothetical protein [Rhizobium viscosum]|uniref:Uncharacterized protein n=1 Tax=Rhizobium viscosum TaxID=1673 RepID=A0ABR9IM34_RHIVS|nr:hypothetical protein [Rhizobium viscosum]MBE1504229.1 hypothetical protein [Rhizobium viscosum]
MAFSRAFPSKVRGFLKYFCLMADRLDSVAVAGSMLVTLMPGESHVFHVTTKINI